MGSYAWVPISSASDPRGRPVVVRRRPGFLWIPMGSYVWVPMSFCVRRRPDFLCVPMDSDAWIPMGSDGL